ncbi:MAG TPA: hypothetical protein VN540_01755 [Clostridia bacterium]|nr:hypothetical protein [Clostridia bacterium]
MKKATAILLALLMALALMPTVALAADYAVNDASGLADALTNAVSGDTVTINHDLTLTAKYNIKAGVTLKAAAGVTVSVSGGNVIFDMEAGSIIKGVTILKTDKTAQDIVNVRASCAVEDCSFTGQFVMGDPQVSRAMLVHSGSTNILIKNNFVNALRQPAYINGGATGSVLGNTVQNTRGFVVCLDSQCIFTNNVFTGNVVDIAIIANDSATGTYYDDKVGLLSTQNNGAYIQNQVTGVSAAGGVEYLEKDGDSTPVQAGAAPTYTIIIPAAVNFGTLKKNDGIKTQEFDVKAQNVLIEDGAKVDVSVTSTFMMKDKNGAGNKELPYKLYNVAGGGTALTAGAVFASFTATYATEITQDGHADVDTSLIPAAGSYQGIMVFTIAYVAP